MEEWHKQPPGTVSKVIKEQVNALKTDNLFPGSKISVDHFACNPHGRLLHTYGKERNDDKFKGGCIFVDHATGYTHVELQSRLNTPETLQAKKDFEALCSALIDSMCQLVTNIKEKMLQEDN